METPAAYHDSLVNYIEQNKKLPLAWRWDKITEHLIDIGIIVNFAFTEEDVKNYITNKYLNN